MAGSVSPISPFRTPSPEATLPLFGLGHSHDDSTASSPDRELHGVPDGAPVRLPSGILVQPERVGDARVTQAELLAAVSGIYKLPEADQRLIAQNDIPVELLPVAGLEDGLLGATTILQDTATSPWRPTLVRVAVRAGLRDSESTPEIVQHELGHVVSVLTRQDRTEEAAIRYAQTY